MGRNGPINVGCPAVLVYDVPDGIRAHALARAIEELCHVATRQRIAPVEKKGSVRGSVPGAVRQTERRTACVWCAPHVLTNSSVTSANGYVSIVDGDIAKVMQSNCLTEQTVSETLSREVSDVDASLTVSA